MEDVPESTYFPQDKDRSLIDEIARFDDDIKVSMSTANGTIRDANGLKWIVGLLNSRYKYLTAETFGCKVNANGVALKKKQLWTLEPFGRNSEEAVCLKSYLGKYLAVDQFGNVTCDSEEKDPGAKFRVIVNDDGRWAFKNAVRGYFLGASDDNLVCSAKARTEGELWTVHLAARPQVNLRSVGRRRYARLSVEQDEIQVDANTPRGEDAIFTLEFREGRYAVHACNGKYLRSDGKLSEECECLFGLEFHGGYLALRDPQGRYVSPIGSKAVLRTRSQTVTKDELFSLEDSVPQADFAVFNEKYVSVKQVEDVLGTENQLGNLKQYSNTVLIQVLLEFICHAFVKDENQKEKLLLEACKRLSKFKILNDLLIMDKNNELRVAMKHKVINFLKQICKEVIPSAELDTSAVNLFEKDYLSTDLKLYYCTNFIELEKIAEGGFGAVYKAQYKLNKLIYAVKKIPFDYKTDANFLMVMREANNFAALSHLNIVRYYSAWIEMANSDDVNKSLSENSSSILDSSKESKREEYSGLVIKERSSNNTKTKNTDSVMLFKSTETSSDFNWVKSHSHSFSDYSDEEIDCNYNNNNEDLSPSNFKIQGVLYIQMEYCDCDLQFWLDKRAETKGKDLPFEMDVGDIFSNIVKGVAHIHSHGIIHRDLKPHNIFYSKFYNTVKIGDFGLATLSGFTIDSSNGTSNGHSCAIGTVPYAAPEQLKSNKYDMKVDIYSLGIILIELINICSTRAEVFHMIETVKNGVIEEEMKKYPSLGNLAKDLISDNPVNRMSAKDILNFLDKDSKGNLAQPLISDNPENRITAKDILNLLDKDSKIKEVVMNEFATKLKEKEETLIKMQDTILQQLDTIIQQHSEISRLNLEIIKLKSGASK